MSRSVFQTSTGRSGTVALVAGVVVAIAPNAFAIASRYFPKHKADFEDAQAIVLVLGGILSGAGGLGAIAGRASAKDQVYSPDWLPGNNKKDLPENRNLS